MAKEARKRVGARQQPSKAATAHEVILPPPWQGMQLRVTLFFNGPFKPPTELWTQLFGEGLQQVNLIPNFTAVGLKDQLVILLASAGTRLDLILSPAAQEPSVGKPPAPDVFDKPQAVALLALDAIAKLESTLPVVTRVAGGGFFRLPVKSRAAGYDLLPRYLPFLSRLDSEWYSEFVLQLNGLTEPRSTPFIRPIRLNRVTKWSVMVNKSLAVEGKPVEGDDSQYGVRAELDVNTPPTEVRALAGLSLRTSVEAMFKEFSSILTDGLAMPVVAKRSR